MADKINVEIALEGGAEVQRQLEDIGKTGQQAFGEIQSAAEQVNLDSPIAQFDDLSSAGQAAFKNIQTAAKNAAVFEQVIQGVKNVEGAFDKLGTAVERMAARMTKSLGAFGILARSLGPVGIGLGAAAAAFVKFGDSAADAMNKLTTEGAKLGLSAQQLDVFQQAFGKLGISADAVIPGLEKLGETVGGNLFNSMQRFIDQLQRTPDSIQRTQLAIQTLGEGLGGQVIAGLQTGTITAEKFSAAIAGTTAVTQQQIAQAAKYQQAINQMAAAWQQFVTVVAAPIITPFIENLTKDLARITAELKVVVAAWELFNAPLDQQAAKAKAVVDAYNALGTAGQTAGQQVANGASIANQATGNLLSTLNAAGQQGAQAGQQVATGLFNITQDANGAAIAIQQGMAAAAVSTDAATAAVMRLGGALRGIEAAIWNKAAFSPTGRIPPDLQTQFAGGGMVGGVGTGTSDSNLAWVSRGEHIMPARAVAQPGVLHFLEALRRSGGNLSRVLDGMGRFALGGLVPRSIPAFAGGGPVGSMSNVTINIPGMAPISGLRASPGVVNDLHRAAALAQVRSGGRKPSRYS